jgi:cytochrome c biogenesis protein CcmG/thiol:disulfide interchange protein DsbE
VEYCLTKETSQPKKKPPLWRRILRNWVLPLGAVLVLMMVVGRLRAPSLPDIAPGFTLRGLDGEIVTLEQLRGKPVVLNFWATWCGPCKVEMPSFNRFAANHPELHVIGIVADGPVPKVQHFIDNAGMTYPILIGDRAVFTEYGVDTYPTTVFLDADGRVVSAHTGLMFQPQLWWATRGL